MGGGGQWAITFISLINNLSFSNDTFSTVRLPELSSGTAIALPPAAEFSHC